MKLFRKAQQRDLSTIMSLISLAKQSLKNQNIPQWQDEGPSQTLLENDIASGQCFVVEVNQTVVGVCVLMNTPEPTYHKIEGQWINNEPYSTIHRFAVHPKMYGQGIGNTLMEGCYKHSQHRFLRIDTHRDNHIMRKLILRHGFEECGIITLDNGALRIAYEKQVR